MHRTALFSSTLGTYSPMTELPRERMGDGHPAFYHDGIDYFGPFNVHVHRSTEKR